MKQIDKDTISIEWEVDVRDVLEIRPDLTKKKARAVLNWLLHNHDEDGAIYYDDIYDACDLLFPEQKKGKQK